MRVVIAESSAEVRSALRLLLEEEIGAEVVGEAGRADDPDTALTEVLVTSRPDLLLLDWELTVDRSAESISLLRATHPGLWIIALSARSEERSAALATGVDGFASKTDGPERLLDVIRSVVQ